MSTQALLDFVYGDTRRGLAGISPEAAAIARSALRRRGLNVSVDDVVQDVVIKIMGTLERNSDRLVINNPAAYFTTVCQRYCHSLARADRRLPMTVDNAILDHVPAPSSAPPPSNSVERLDMARATIEALGTRPIAVSGALTWLMLAYHPEIALEDVPRPRAGVAADLAAGWPSLWFATRQRGLFGTSTAASRRRQRAINEIVRLRGRAIVHLRSVMRP